MNQIDLSSVPDITKLKTRRDALASRIEKIDESVNEILPVTDEPLMVQQAFLLTVADLHFLEDLLTAIDKSFYAIELAEFGKLEEPMELVVERWGVSRDIVVLSIMKDLARNIELTETVVRRAEASLLYCD